MVHVAQAWQTRSGTEPPAVWSSLSWCGPAESVPAANCQMTGRIPVSALVLIQRRHAISRIHAMPTDREQQMPRAESPRQKSATVTPALNTSASAFHRLRISPAAVRNVNSGRLNKYPPNPVSANRGSSPYETFTPGRTASEIVPTASSTSSATTSVARHGLRTRVDDAS